MGPSPLIMKDIPLDEKGSYNLRSGITVTKRNIKTKEFGFETTITIESIPWGKLPIAYNYGTKLPLKIQLA